MANNLNQGPPQAAPQNQSEALAYLAALNATVGRFQGPEQFWIDTVDLAAPSTVNVSRQLNLNRPIESMQIVLTGRMTVSVDAIDNVFPEAPQTLLQNVLLNGTHRVFGNLTPIRLSGATIFAWQRMFQNIGNDCLIAAGGALTRVADPGRPFVSGIDGATGDYDFVLVYTIPFGPTVGPGQSTKRDLSSFMLQPADWGDTLQLQLSFGDATVIGDVAASGATVVFTSFGSATGLPQYSIHLNYGILGTFANSFQTGVMIRQEQLYRQFVSAGLEQRIMQLQKQITSNVLVKSGTLPATGLSAGTSAFDTLSDLILDRTQIRTDNKPVRNNQSNFASKAYLQRMYNTIQPEGYFDLSFVEAQNIQLAYRGDGLSAGSLFELWSDILTSDADQVLTVTQEMAYGGPFPPLR